jgi:hypothetical protein
MKGTIAASCIVCLGVFSLCAQDEGTVIKKKRIQLDKSIFVGGGISIVGGSNFGDYSRGINFEAGYTKRLNRIFSIGGSLSYLSFKYDPSILQKPPAQYQDPVNFYYGYDIASNEIGALLDLSGGDLSMISLAFNLKFNFVPVKDNSLVSVYAFAKPFITSAALSGISGLSQNYIRDMVSGDWGSPVSSTVYTYKEDPKISGGILLGPGLELFPAKKISFFVQASFGYTFPIEIVSTRSYNSDIENLTSPKFPYGSLGFTSINFAGGISFNLD